MAFLALPFLIVYVVGYIWVIIAAFQDSFWQGALATLIPCYWFYYAFVEFDHDHKWWILLATLGSPLIASALIKFH